MVPARLIHLWKLRGGNLPPLMEYVTCARLSNAKNNRVRA
jgi:hypothetical protein